ncbi:MAG: CotH kinase family protein [Clostridia bacterium]|nr:CotH kinase family protein [Clostridia bacterium]
MYDKSGDTGDNDAVTVVNAIAVKEGENASDSEVYTSTYILNSSAENFEDRYNGLAVFSVSIDNLVLRAGGNDSILTGERSTGMRDSLVHALAKPIENLACQNVRPVVVYLNGQYWGLYYLYEDLDNDYIESHYGTDSESLAILAYGHENGEWFYKIDEGTDDDLNEYKKMIEYISSKDMSQAVYYEKACNMLDLDNFMKYMAVNIYVNNRDWPHNNVRMWKFTGLRMWITAQAVI